jgi:hypothetical protein
VIASHHWRFNLLQHTTVNITTHDARKYLASKIVFGCFLFFFSLPHFPTSLSLAPSDRLCYSFVFNSDSISLLHFHSFFFPASTLTKLIPWTAPGSPKARL